MTAKTLKNQYPALASDRTMALLCLLLIVMAIAACMTAPEVPLGLMHVSGPVTLTVQMSLIAICLKGLSILTPFTRRPQVRLLRKLRQQHGYSQDVMSLKLTYRTTERFGKIAGWLATAINQAISEQTAKVVKRIIHLLRSWR